MAKLYNLTKPSFISDKHIHLILHITVWIVLFMLPTYFFYADSGNDKTFLYRAYFQIFLYAVIFYANYLWLSPRLFFRKKKVLYFVAALALVAATTFVNELAFSRSTKVPIPGKMEREMFLRMPPPPGIPFAPNDFPMGLRKRPGKNLPIYNFLLTTLFLSGFGMGLSFSDKLRLHEKERKEAEKEMLNTELAFLKNQINPHFFFNTLNNIYSLVQTDVADGQKAILQLSKLMRYLLYETEKGNKLLSEEIEFMRTYIELMKLRISEKVSFLISFPENYKDISIPPLLFLPFIENAFKHGISYRNHSFINVILEVLPGTIIFECSNSLVAHSGNMLRQDSGIGLENVKKRLVLLFPENHNLKVTETETTFQVILQINIS